MKALDQYRAIRDQAKEIGEPSSLAGFCAVLLVATVLLTIAAMLP